LSERVIRSGSLPRVRPADLAGPIASYRRYVAAQLAPMQADAEALASAVQAGDLAAARAAWLSADGRYEAIGAAYGAFGDLDASIDGGSAGLPGGIHSTEFTGLHRIELALWGRDSTADAEPYVDRLRADVARLRHLAPSIEIEALEYVLRCHEVLEGTLDLQLSGRRSPWSGAALVALRSNVKGTEMVLGTLRPMIRRRNRPQLERIEAVLAELRRGIEELEAPGGAMPRWDHLPEAKRIRIAGLAAGAAEQLAYVPEIVDPRPALPPKSAIGAEQG
jgi:iron uptake system EfeUOB component EfeO/EfeM